MNIINRKTAWFLHNELSDSHCSKVNNISELLCMKYHYIHLAMLSSDEVHFVIEALCTSYFFLFLGFFLFLCLLVYDVQIQGGPKTGPYLKSMTRVCDNRKAFNISKCSALY